VCSPLSATNKSTPPPASPTPASRSASACREARGPMLAARASRLGRQQARRNGGLAPAITPVAAVVTDATTLYVRTLLPALNDVLVSGIRDLLLADPSYTDIIDARDKIFMPTAGMLTEDPETGQYELRLVSASEQARHQAAADAVFALAGACRRLPLPARSPRDDLERLAGPGLDPWIGGVRLAAARGIALWADDAALRRLARGAGIPAFSTLALLDAYSTLGLVSAGQRENAVRNLISGCVGDSRRTSAACGSSRRAMTTAAPRYARPSRNRHSGRCRRRPPVPTPLYAATCNPRMSRSCPTCCMPPSLG
jgi:hypothetical protein